MTWEPIEEQKALSRKSTGGAQHAKNFSEAGEVRNIIARRVGLGSGVTYEKGKAVVERIDREFRHGDIFRYGDILRTQLNGQSITAAWNTLEKIVREPGARERVSE
jgi:ParB family chromosome partitioning protein